MKKGEEKYINAYEKCGKGPDRKARPGGLDIKEDTVAWAALSLPRVVSSLRLAAIGRFR